MEIEQIEKEPESLFVAKENGAEMGRIYYSWSANGALIINHTEVHQEFKGKGVGKALVLYVVEYARTNKVKIVPVCRFAKGLFERTSEIQDVL